MKTTIKLTHSKTLTVQPTKAGGVVVEFLPILSAVNDATLHLTQDQAGALIFALEQAAEAAQLKFDRDQSAIVGNRATVQAMEDRLAA